MEAPPAHKVVPAGKANSKDGHKVVVLQRGDQALWAAVKKEVPGLRAPPKGTFKKKLEKDSKAEAQKAFAAIKDIAHRQAQIPHSDLGEGKGLQSNDPFAGIHSTATMMTAKQITKELLHGLKKLRTDDRKVHVNKQLIQTNTALIKNTAKDTKAKKQGSQ